MEYTLAEHLHRFGVWAACRAASTKSSRFSVRVGKEWIESIERLRQCSACPENLPEIHEFDSVHAAWREKLIVASGYHKVSHGTAAKLINVYLKAVVIHAGVENEAKVGAIHPPIDRVLLAELTRKKPDIWRGQKLSWSTFDSLEYQAVIDKVRQTLKANEPLWRIEDFWIGHQAAGT